MASLFISYSRNDKDFTRKLTQAFEGQGLDLWIDWEDIEPTVDWWEDIKKGIEEADNFLLLLSPDSMQSKYCNQEIEYAIKNGKRLIPVVIREIDWNNVAPDLGKLNSIFMDKIDEFQEAFKKLIAAIHTDYA